MWRKSRENSFALQTKHKFAYILSISSVHILFGCLQCDYFLFTRAIPSIRTYIYLQGPVRYRYGSVVACGHNTYPIVRVRSAARKAQSSGPFPPRFRGQALLPADVPIFDGIMQRLFSSSPDQIDESNCRTGTAQFHPFHPGRRRVEVATEALLCTSEQVVGMVFDVVPGCNTLVRCW